MIRVEIIATLLKAPLHPSRFINGMLLMNFRWFVLTERMTILTELDWEPLDPYLFAVVNRHSAVANDGRSLASDGSLERYQVTSYTSTSGLNSKWHLIVVGTINGSNTKTLNSWSIDTFHRGDVTNWGSTGSIFHNGTLDASGSLGANTLLSLSAFNIGNWDDGSTKQRHLDGDLAELIIYPANLSDP